MMAKKYWKFTDGTARWKYDSPFENYLSHLADHNEFMKMLYVLFYRIIDGSFYKNGLKFIDNEIENFTKRGGKLVVSRKKTIRDMVYSLHRFGAMFDEYFLYEFYNKNVFGREEYICDKYRYDYYRLMNKDENRQFFDDKGKTYQLFKEFYKRDVLSVESREQREAFLEFIKKHTKVIIKPLASSGGRNVRKCEINSEESEELFEILLGEGPFVIEELVIQTEAMAQFHPASLNTVRVPTIVTRKGTAIFAPYFRTGRGDSIVDNGFAGGILAAVDEESGIITSLGTNEKGEQFLKHPDTQVPILGFQLPEWDKAVELVTKLSKVIPDNRYAAWDIAHTKQGWVMIEGNARGQILSQMADKKGRKKQLFELINS